MKLTSSAFVEGSPIPDTYTGAGTDLSPPLAWTDVPAGTKSFALVCDDPDAPAKVWVHWVVWDIPASACALAQGFDGGKQGRNDSRSTGYSGPYPPPGKPHRYFFRLYALSAPLALPASATKADLERAMQGKILAEAQLMGTYRRS